MKDENKTHVLEYSFKQKCFHIQELSVSLQYSISDLMKGCSSEYVILLISKDRDVLLEISQVMKVRVDRNRPFTVDEAKHVSEAVAKHQSKLIWNFDKPMQTIRDYME